MFKKGIARRWLFNSLGVMILLFTACIAALSFVVQSYAYNGIQMTLIGRSDELPTVLSGSMKTVSEFNAAARSYTENFPDKDLMEVMAVSRSGSILSTSSGFAPDQNQGKPDFESALHSENGYGYWIGKLASGEKVMAVSRVARGANGAVLGAVRYIVSMERADRQITYVVLVLIGIGVLILVLVTLSGIYFVRSIITPIRELNATAEKIAKGDFDVRVKKEKDDELGALCDSINDMAAELGTAEKMKNDFISSVSHELRTPLSAVRGLTEALSDGLIKTEEDRARYYGYILHECLRLSRLIDDLLELSRLQSGTEAMEPAKLNVTELIEEMPMRYETLAEEKGIEFTTDLMENCPYTWANADRVEQILTILLDNAFKFTPPEGRVWIETQVQNQKILVRVKNSGDGIQPEDLPHVFERFYKADKAHTGGGTGLGLSIASEILQRMEESISVSSVPGQTTTFSFTLPVYDAEQHKTEEQD